MTTIELVPGDEGITWDDDKPWWLGLCPECGAIKDFGTERERDIWERNHTHDGEQGAA